PPRTLSTAPSPPPISTLSLHDALPISTIAKALGTGTIQNDDTQPALSIDDVVKPEGTTSSTPPGTTAFPFTVSLSNPSGQTITRSEEHTSELQSRGHLVCRLLLEKKKT